MRSLPAKFFLYILPFTAVIVWSTLYYPYVVGKAVFFRGCVEIACVLALILWMQGEELFEKIRKYPLSTPVAVLMGALLLGTIFGIDPAFSFWSSFERMEGMFQTLHYGMLFFLLLVLFRQERDWDRLFTVSLIAGYLVILAVPLITMLHGETQWGIMYKQERFIGSLGNAAYAGAYFLFSLFYSAILATRTFFKKEPSPHRGTLLSLIGVSSIIFTIFLFLSGTRGAFLGLGAGIIATTIFMLRYGSPSVKIFAKRTGIAIAICGALTLVGGTVLPERYCAPCHRLMEISPSESSNTPRIHIWRTAIESAVERPFLGWGPENFYAAFNHRFDPFHFDPRNPAGSEMRIDRPHNIYLQYLLDAGIVGLSAFIAIFAVLYHAIFRLLKKRKGALTSPQLITLSIIFGSSIAYLVNAFFAVEVLATAFNLFIFLAFSSFFIRSIEKGTNERTAV